MDFFSLKERFYRLVIAIGKIKSLGFKNIIFLTVLPIALVSLIFGFIFLKQERLLRQRENMLKSFYSEDVGKDEDSNSQASEFVFIHVCGLVKEPGVYKLEAGSRVIDAIEAAGGIKQQAYTEGINLAGILQDGQKVFVPDSEQALDPGGNNSVQSVSGEKININTATRDELEGLPGIGPVTAQRIIDYRMEKKGFSSIEELKEVNGIGQKKFDEIKELVCV